MRRVKALTVTERRFLVRTILQFEEEELEKQVPRYQQLVRTPQKSDQIRALLTKAQYVLQRDRNAWELEVILDQAEALVRSLGRAA